MQGLKLVVEVFKTTGRKGETAQVSTRGERWLNLDHPKVGAERGRAVQSPGSCGSPW